MTLTLKKILWSNIIAIFFLISSCNRPGNYQGEWSTYIPSEYGYDYHLKENGSCELHYQSPASIWTARSCTWEVDGNRIDISFKTEKVKVEYFDDESDKSWEGHITIKPHTIIYTLDPNYLGAYLRNLGNCKNEIKIKGILAMKPDRHGSCNEGWCTEPFFKITDAASFKNLNDIEYTCNQ